MKLYIHHFFTDQLFYLVAHNTTDRVFDINDEIGTIKCRYKNIDLELVFNPELSNEEDGYHLIDYNTTRSQSVKDKKFNSVGENKRIGIASQINNGVNNTLYNLTDIIPNRENWIFTFFNGEKTLYKYENLDYYNHIELLHDVEKSLCKLNNCKIITEEFFLKDEIELKYPNFYYTFSNSMWYWNNHAEIRWYYEFKNIFDSLNFK